MNGKEIMGKLSGLGTQAETVYTNQEMVDCLREFQSAIAHEICGADEYCQMRADSIVQIVGNRAEKVGLSESEHFVEFKQDMEDLGREIALTISGLKGEMKGFRALKPLEFDHGVKVLHNICLQDGEGRTEFDSIVVTPYGVFIIEMKNCRKPMVITEDGYFQKLEDPDYQYPLGERMCCKETLLREAMDVDFEVPVYGTLLLVNDSDLHDRFGRVMTTNRNTVVYKIRSYSKERERLSDEQVEALTASILSHHSEMRYPCSLDCERVTRNLACLMDELDAAEAKPEAAPAPSDAPQKRAPSWMNTVAGFAAGFAGVSLAVLGPLAASAIKAAR